MGMVGRQGGRGRKQVERATEDHAHTLGFKDEQDAEQGRWLDARAGGPRSRSKAQQRTVRCG